MYHFSYFKEPERTRLLQFMEEHPFIFLTGSFLNGHQVATQVPVVVTEKADGLYLEGHLMRNTDHHSAFVENAQVLAVFTGPSAYVSASWYTTPGIGSTWNYMSIHVPGLIRFLTSTELMDLMHRFTLKFEAGNTQSPTVYANLTSDYLGKMMPAIVGFEIKIETIENVFKLSQNRDEQSYTNIIAQLRARGGGSSAVAEEMEKRKTTLFSKGNRDK
jgi:transcriptional regulator